MVQKSNSINSELIKAIKSNSKGSAIQLLSQILPMSKEALYRRFKGSVLFNYSEAVLIAQYLQISLDDIAFGNASKDFVKKNNGNDNIVEAACNWNTEIQRHAISASKISFMTAGLPGMIAKKYENLLKFDYYILLYRIGKVNGIQDSFGTVSLPKELFDSCNQTISMLKSVNQELIISDNCFAYYKKQINFLKELDLIDNIDIALIKRDLNSVFEDINAEVSSRRASTSGEGNTIFYLSKIDIDNTCGIIDNKHRSVTFTKMLELNSIVSPNNLYVIRNKSLIDGIKNFSTVISQSGSKERLAFLKKQAAVLADIS